MEPELYFKVLQKDIDGTLWSAGHLNVLTAKYCVQYQVGVWARPRLAGSRLMVFKELSDARRFMGSSCPVYSCLARYPARLDIMCDLSEHEHFDYFWKKVLPAFRQKQAAGMNGWLEFAVSSPMICGSPAGTYSATAVKLVERIHTTQLR